MNTKFRNHIYYFDCENDDNINHQNTSNITKVVPIDYYVENEIKNVKKLKQHIQNYNLFFYLFDNIDVVKIAKMNETIYHLKQVDKIKHDNTVIFSFENKNLIYMEKYLQSLTSPRRYIYVLIEFFKHLNCAIQLLVSCKLVSNHINMNSIVIDTFDTPLLCNFKFSIDMSLPNIIEHLRHLFIVYEPTYLPWCPELHILSYLFSNKLDSLSIYNIENIIGECIEQNYILRNFGCKIISEFKETGINYFKKYVNKSVEFIVNDIITHWQTWDNYAFSILYLQLVIGIHKKIKKNNKFIIVFMKLLVKNINVNPTARLSPEDTYKHFEDILYSIVDTDKLSYIDLINSI